MCNLYTERLGPDAVAAHFNVRNPLRSNVGGEVYPGTPGTEIREEAGERVMETMTWGFPLRLKGISPTAKPKPVNNIAASRQADVERACRQAALAVHHPIDRVRRGRRPEGAKTRTWFTVKGQAIFGWAGLWRVSDEWGPVYSGVMTDCNEAIRPVHDRMPVLLLADEYERWLHGTYDDALGFQARCFPDGLINMTRTDELWVKKKPAPEAPAVLL